MSASNSKPQRIQRKRAKGWKAPDGAVNVTRPGKWGNPFRVGGHYKIGTPGRGGFAYLEAYEGHQDETFTTLKSVRECVEWFRVYRTRYPYAPMDLATIRGKDLMCWCKPGDPCHADVLLEMANQ